MNIEEKNIRSLESDDYRPTASRILGVYPQKQKGVYMQRIKIFGGRINWLQWRRIAELADKCSRNFPLHITTRQDIELHNVSLEDIPFIHQGLAEVALNIFGACGDSVRNITVCSACDVCKAGYDLLPIAGLVRQNLEQQSAILNLPRKFKISFSGCKKACTKPWLNDIGFIAQPDGLFTIIGAGSLGPNPSLGIEFYKNFQTQDILPFCVASIELFNKFGDRENRRRARFRHVREKLGEQNFRAELNERFTHIKTSRTWPELSIAQNKNENIKLLYRLQLTNGNITPQEAIELADIAEPKGTILRINLEHGLEIYGTEGFKLPDNLSILANNPIVIACPGSATCISGLTDCWATADRIRKALSISDTGEMRINISGCPNNCGQSAVADIGLVGLLRKKNGRQTPHYRVLTGGGNGENHVLATQYCIVEDKDVPRVIELLLKDKNICLKDK